MPVEKLENGAWPHPARLPLGCGWSGYCTVPGYESEILPREVLEEFCNLGYAAKCSRLPQERAWDAVRFAVSAKKDRTVHENGCADFSGASRIVQLRYVCERQHAPVEHGTLEFDGAGMRWLRSHADSRVQKMADCFLKTYMAKGRPEAVDDAAVSSLSVCGPSERES
jgi:hypothetical protein